MISRSRLKRAETVLAERCRNPRAEAHALANDLVATLVAMDLLHVELGVEWPTDPRQLLDHVATLWRQHANDLGVPNDGSAERRILALCRGVLTGDIATANPHGAKGLVDRLEQGSRDGLGRD